MVWNALFIYLISAQFNKKYDECWTSHPDSLVNGPL